jgi:hypothetical protein
MMMMMMIAIVQVGSITSFEDWISFIILRLTTTLTFEQ